MVNIDEFGSVRNLLTPVNRDVVYDNQLGMATISFHLSMPGSGTVQFEGTYDGTNWISAEMRNVAGSYVTSATATGNFVGSIAQFRKFRVRVSVALAAESSVIGMATDHITHVFSRT